MTEKRIRIILDSKQANQDAKKLDQSVKEIGKSSDNTVFSVKKLASAIAAAFAAARIAAFAKDAVDSFAAFEKGLIGVGKTTDISGQELEDFGGKIRELTRTIPVAATELLSIAQAAGQLGVSGTENIIKFTEVIAKLGGASDLAGEAAATSLARILTVTGTDVSKIDRLGSTIVELGNNFAATESEIAAVATRVSQSTVQFKVTAAEVLGISTALKAVGVEAESGGTQVGLAFQAINDAIRGGGKEMQALQQITGKTQQELSKAFFGGKSTQVFKGFIDGLGEIQKSGGDVSAALEAVGLKGTQAVSVLSTLASRSELLANTLKTANKEWEDNIALNKEAATASKSFSAQMQIVKNSADEAASAIGSIIAPKVLDFMGEFRDASFFIAANIEDITRVVEVLSVAIGTRLAVAVASSALIFVNSVKAEVVAINAASAASAAASVTVSKYTGAVISSAVAADRATIANQLLSRSAVAARGAMALLGGPLGIVLIAAASLYTFYSNAKDADDASKSLTQSTDVLTQSMEGLTKAQAEAQKIDAVKEIKAQEVAISDLQQKIDRMKVTTEDGFQITLASFDEEVLIKTEAAIDSAQAKIDQLRERIGSLDETIAGKEPVKRDPIVIEKPDKPKTEKQQISADNEIESSKATTAALERELNYRRQVAQIYRDGELEDTASQYEKAMAMQRVNEQTKLAENEARYAEDLARRQERFLASLENDALEEEQKVLLKQEFDNQLLLSAELFEQEKTSLLQQGANDRAAVEKAEMQSRLDNAKALGGALMSLGQGQSKKVFKIGQTLALAQASAALPSAVIQSFQNGGGYPWGLAPAGAMLATGLQNINSIRKAGAGLGGGSGGSAPSISLPSGGGSSMPAPPASSTASTVTAPTQQPTQYAVTFQSDGVFTGEWVNNQLKELKKSGGVIVSNDS